MPSEQIPHFPLIHHLHPAMVSGAGKRTGAIADGQRQAVQGSHFQAGQISGSLLHLGPGPHIERHQAHGPWIDAEVAHQVAGPLGEHSSFARPGRGHDAGSPAQMADRGPLIIGQIGLGGGGIQRSQAAN